MKDLWEKKNKIKQACLFSCVLLPQHQPSEYPCPHWAPLLLTFGTLISLGEFGPFPSKPVNKTFATFFCEVSFFASFHAWGCFQPQMPRGKDPLLSFADSRERNTMLGMSDKPVSTLPSSATSLYLPQRLDETPACVLGKYLQNK